MKLHVESLGSGADLVLLHSLLSDASAFDPVKNALAAAFRLHLVDLPGYRQSPPGDEESVEAYADAVAASLPAQSVVLLGNGFGGFIALAAALRHPGRVAKLIAAPALAGFPEPAKQPFRVMAEKVRASGMQAVLDAAIARMFPPAFLSANPAIVEERKSALAKADPGSFARACIALARLDLKPQLSRIKIPTLVVAGELDQATPAALARELAQGIHGAVFHEIEGCGHCPQIEKPMELVDKIKQFAG